jgi:hypothetical protein
LTGHLNALPWEIETALREAVSALDSSPNPDGCLKPTTPKQGAYFEAVCIR